MRDLPIAMMGIRWTVNGVAGTETFSDVCKELYKNSGFFQFYDEEFFQAVREKIMDTEDYALNFDNNEYTRVAFDAELVSLRKRLRSLYKLIMDRCL